MSTKHRFKNAMIPLTTYLLSCIQNTVSLLFSVLVFHDTGNSMMDVLEPSKEGGVFTADDGGGRVGGLCVQRYRAGFSSSV